MDINVRQDATGPLAGYLYQVLAALLLLLKNEEPQSQLCIEKFDDISFVKGETPYEMIQTKHQLNKRGSLINTSVDLWRTIRNWCNSINVSKDNLADTKFVIITTAIAQEKTAAYYLCNANYRDYKQALTILRDVATDDNGKTNKDFYEVFLSLDNPRQENLVKNIYIFDNSPQIGNVKKYIMPYIRNVTLPQYEDRVYDRVVGWWINSIIKCLNSKNPIFITGRQLQIIISDIGSEYKNDSLPIDIDIYYEPTDGELDALSSEKKLFIEQLNLISLSNARLNRCIRDYYNAYRQRSRWVREQLLLINELEKYENALIDEWNRLFLIMIEDLEDYGSEISEDEKIKAGKTLFNEIEDLDYPIRERVAEPFIMRGSYHELANQMKVGWHVDFLDRLCHLLKR